MYFSARSASWNPLLFQHTTRCHSVFSCFSPPCPVHCRLVASDSVATREPLVVLRTSGSAPKFPISMTLLRLRLTTDLRALGGSGTKGDNSICPASYSVNQRYATWAKVLQTPRPRQWRCTAPPRPRPAGGSTGPAGPPP